MFKQTLLFTFLVCIFIGCASTEVSESADVNQAKIYQNYYVNINMEDNDSYVDAVFRFGGSTGTTLNLSDPSHVTVNGEKMSGEDRFLQGQVYGASGVYAENNRYEFTFTDVDGNVYTNAIAVEPIEFKDLPDSFDRNLGIEIAWNGAPLGKHETVTVHLNANDGEYSSASASTSLKGATSVTISPKKLHQFPSGLCNVQLVRTISSKLDEGTDEGGKIRGEYESVILPLTIEGEVIAQ